MHTDLPLLNKVKIFKGTLTFVLNSFPLSLLQGFFFLYSPPNLTSFFCLRHPNSRFPYTFNPRFHFFFLFFYPIVFSPIENQHDFSFFHLKYHCLWPHLHLILPSSQCSLTMLFTTLKISGASPLQLYSSVASATCNSLKQIIPH